MSDLELLTLLAVRLRSRGPLAAVTATVLDLLDDRSSLEHRDNVSPLIERMISAGQVRRRGEEGRLSLSPRGEAELAAGLGADLDALVRAEIVTAYEAFLPINRAFLAACVMWQNDPTNTAQIAELVERVRPVVDAATAARQRFASYSRRLAAALAESTVDPRWIDQSRVDSLHTVWFELHEHLLATLGRDRTSER